MTRGQPGASAPWRACFVTLMMIGVTADVPRAQACGPSFPERHLLDRERLLVDLPAGTFAREAALLVRPRDAFVVQEGEEPGGVRDRGGARERALYADGAQAWHAHDPDRAVRAWRALLALPAEQRRARSTWAAYMVAKATGTGFDEVRALARAGFDDELGLAVASLGDEAFLLLAVGDISGAVALYAEQAALGSVWGASSLAVVARRVLADPTLLAIALVDPLSTRLLGIFLDSRPGAVNAAQLDAILDVVDRVARRGARGPPAAAAGHFAAVAYRAGRFDVAERLAAHAMDERAPDDTRDSGASLAAWVRARLALRAGDTGRADEELRSVRDGLHARIHAERAALALHHARAADALTLLLEGSADPFEDLWFDAAYVAERVLTLPELRAFVDAYAPAAQATEHERALGLQLRALLARRLVRAGAVVEAQTYVDDPITRAHLHAFATALRTADTHTGVTAARARFDAARLLRRHGMELMGFELDPDWAVVEGRYDLGDGATLVSSSSSASSSASSAGALRALVLPPGPWAPDEERRRVAQSHAEPVVRFHYRARAAALAVRAAESVPPHTQAFGAMLCHAAAWIGPEHPDHNEIVQALWQRYLREGKPVAFGSSFGVSCAEPLFTP